jgi:hypothetical protein
MPGDCYTDQQHREVHAIRRPIVVAAVLLALAAPAAAQLKALETKDFRVVYFPAEEYLAKHVARAFENALQRHEQIFHYTPTEKITLFLHDFGDSGNAGAAAVPNNRILITIAPFSYTFEVVRGNERMNWLASHELVHILATDKPAPRDQRWRRLFFGKVAPTSDNPLSMIFTDLTTPRYYAPRWYHEGIAVFMETWLTGGFGRAMGAYDEMVFRTMVAENAPMYDLVGLESAAGKVDFQVGVNAYLYGTRFMSYLADRCGPQDVVEWVSGTDDRRASYAAQFEKVFKLPLSEAWSQWEAWEHTFQEANLARIRTNPVTSSHDVSRRALGSVSRAVLDPDGKHLYLAVDYPGQVAHLASLDLATGELKRIVDVKGAALYYVCSIALDPATRTLFYTTDNNDLRDLRGVDLATGRRRTYLEDARIGDLAFDRADRSLWGVRHYNGISTLVRIPYPYREWNQIYSLPYATDIYDLDISPDGTQMVAAITRPDGSQSLVRMEIAKLRAGELSEDVLQDFENSSPATFVFSPDGRYLYGSSYYSGVSNLYRVDLATRDVEPLTNADTGFFRPVPLSDSELLAFRYTAEGFRPVTLPIRPVQRVSAIRFLGEEVVEKRPELKEWKLPPPSSVDLDPLIRREGDYSPFATMRVRSIVPAVLGYKDDIAVGLRASLTDAVGYNRLALGASYSPAPDLKQSEKLHLMASYTYLNWKVLATLNPADFYDIFGPTKRSRRGYSLGVTYKRYLIFDQPNRSLDYEVNVAGWGNLETLPEYQGIESTAKSLLLASVSLGYKNERNSLGAVQPEKGVMWRATVGDTVARGVHYPDLTVQLDVGVALPLSHSSVWLRTAAGAAGGDRNQPFANFYFGAFGNNWVDDKPYRRFQEPRSLPGIEINQTEGHTYGKTMLEWDVPPLVFRHLGTPSLFANWASLALFSTALVTDIDRASLRRKIYDVGAQLDIRIVAALHHQFTLSLGYALAFEEGRHRASEFMASLKIPFYE